MRNLGFRERVLSVFGISTNQAVILNILLSVSDTWTSEHHVGRTPYLSIV